MIWEVNAASVRNNMVPQLQPPFSIVLSSDPSIKRSFYPSIERSVYLTISLGSLFLFLPTTFFLSTYLSGLYLLSTYLFIYLVSIYYLPTYLSGLYLSIYLVSIFLSTYLSIWSISIIYLPIYLVLSIIYLTYLSGPYLLSTYLSIWSTLMVEGFIPGKVTSWPFTLSANTCHF